jgi:ADP-heptose:LPS heptosyltransferase
MLKSIAKRFLDYNRFIYLKRTISSKRKRLFAVDKVRNILCIQMNAIGDGIMTQPVWSALKSKITNARIDLICRPQIAPIFKEDVSLDSIYAFETENYRNWLFKRRSELETLIIEGNYDLLIDFTALPLTAAVCAKENVPPSIGFSRVIPTKLEKINLGMAYDINFEYSEVTPIRELMTRLISPWLNGTKINRIVPSIILDNTVTAEAKKILKDNNLKENEYIVLHPGAKWHPKKWPHLYWQNLIDLSLKQDLVPYLILGNHDDKYFIHQIVDHNSNPNIHTLINERLEVSAALIKLAKLCVCNDSAAMHISAAVGTPSIAIFGPVSPERSAPSSDENCTVLSNNEFCSPCALYYSKSRCRRGINFCMRSVDPKKVLDSINEKCQTEYNMAGLIANIE